MFLKLIARQFMFLQVVRGREARGHRGAVITCVSTNDRAINSAFINDPGRRPRGTAELRSLAFSETIHATIFVFGGWVLRRAALCNMGYMRNP